MIAATLDRRHGLEVVGRRRLFTESFTSQAPWGNVAPDGRLRMIHRGPRSVPDRIDIVLNWTTELERLAGSR